MTDKQYESSRVRYNNLIEEIGYECLMIGESGTEAKGWGLPGLKILRKDDGKLDVEFDEDIW